MQNSYRLSIGEISKKYNCSTRTLRFYEERGILAPERVDRQRYYTAKDEVRLQLVLRGKGLGLRLKEIEALILSKGEGSDVEATALLLPREKILDQLAALTERRIAIDMAIAELREAHARAQ